MKSGKVWGTTELIEANGSLEFHRIEMERGGVCSKHMHRFKWNGFYVESGIMKVKVWQPDYHLIDETLLGPGEWTKVKPGVYHQFECIEDGVAFEVYWAELSHSDIVRETTGFKKPEKIDISMGDTVSVDVSEKETKPDPDINLTINTSGIYGKDIDFFD